jgi:DNA polymerase-3 subunit chi
VNINITFLQLDTDDQSDINKITCDLIYQFYKNKQDVYILCPSIEYTYQLDEYILTYIEKNFFPYQLVNSNLKFNTLVPNTPCLSHEPATTLKLKSHTLINLSTIIPDNFIKYKNIIELIPKQPENREISREHYKHYIRYTKNINIINSLDLNADLLTNTER